MKDIYIVKKKSVTKMICRYCGVTLYAYDVEDSDLTEVLFIVKSMKLIFYDIYGPGSKASCVRPGIITV